MTLVGRTAAIRTLGEALTDCAAGRCGIVLIEGPTGCGKSSLVHAVVEQAVTAGAVVLCAVGVPTERGTPFGVLRQLVNSDRLIAMPGITVTDTAPPRIEEMQSFCAELREMSEDAPVVLCVDDIQYTDDESLAFLQYLAHHARSARILLVAAGTPHHEAGNPAFATELMRQPAFRRIRLGLLQAEEVGALARSAGRDGHAPFLAEASGGNPLLLRALLDERSDTRDADARLEPGGPFAQAVRACLHRAGPTTAAVAQAVALLDSTASPDHVAELLGSTPAAVRQGLAALEAAGITAGGRLRHLVLRDAVLGGLSADRLLELHRHAAFLLQRRGYPATEAAEHLLAAAACGNAHWTASAAETEVLGDAAEACLATDDGRRALELLELAHQVCADEQQRNVIAIRLAQITWRFDPAAAERRLTGLLAVLRAGSFDGERVQPLTPLLLLQGQLTEASELLRHRDGGADDEAAAPLDTASPLDTVLDTSAGAANRLLLSATLTDATLTPIVQALQSLILSDHPKRAVPWSRELLEEAGRCGAPGWGSVFATLHAQALLRLGDLAGACSYATRALETVPERSGGTFRYAATAVLIQAHSAMGNYTESSRQCDRPLPRGLLDSLHGLAFLRARGLHHLTGNQPQAALADFMAIGRIMQSRGIDRPAFLPWRSDAAQALLRLGKPQQAERLVLQQLAMPDARRAWVRGQSLHQRALTVGSSRQRVSLLEQAVDELQRSGDRLATARAMADLGRTTPAAGNTPLKGTGTRRAAWSLAKECGAAALCKEILPDAPFREPGGELASQPGDERAESRLSRSEQRVATLAAQGLTNREISAKLYLTVSTVEQHLTKVYRKLQINGRGDLPMDLALAGARGGSMT
ncbi:helix-turn-helix transcriptional regulator [Kitasatospora sp. NBC_01266]|uniref:helix-turn-helix transcriptional regulator n=1 Tax=Kitasatospora sp. NBC_01266 TaxID=2903572 RepID=UPI002E3657C2|nr:LuxR family transcriptional regulator [Kitasatospora sp. NBC_01266]